MNLRTIPILLVTMLLATGILYRCSHAQEKAPPRTDEKPKVQFPLSRDARVVLLHHSTGECIWNGGLQTQLNKYNAAHKTRYTIREQAFPKDAPYGWENYPYDYWQIWVKNAGAKPFRTEPTLEMLTPKFDLILWKHCFPVSNIEADTATSRVDSPDKTLANYKLQYDALKKKMRQFPKTRFLVWTAAALVKGETSPAQAKRAQAFVQWVKTQWDEPGDNIYVWDFHTLETRGGLYLPRDFAQGDSHPNETFSRQVAPLLANRIAAVLIGQGDTTTLTGHPGKPKPHAKTPAPIPAITPKTPAKPKTPTATTPKTPTPKIDPNAPGKLAFCLPNDSKSVAAHWPKSVTQAMVQRTPVMKLQFPLGLREDWGEYGRHRTIRSRPPKTNTDIRPYRYLALRVRTTKPLTLVLALQTFPKPNATAHSPHFAFQAYLKTKANAWQWIVFDLTKLELSVEGEGGYKKAGSPSRPEFLTALKFAANEKDLPMETYLSEILFLKTLPKDLKPFLQGS